MDSSWLVNSVYQSRASVCKELSTGKMKQIMKEEFKSIFGMLVWSLNKEWNDKKKIKT